MIHHHHVLVSREKRTVKWLVLPMTQIGYTGVLYNEPTYILLLKTSTPPPPLLLFEEEDGG